MMRDSDLLPLRVIEEAKLTIVFGFLTGQQPLIHSRMAPYLCCFGAEPRLSA
jgi:hypothetical protein